MRWIVPGRVGRTTLDALLAASVGARVTYDHVGSTLGPVTGRTPNARSTSVGSDPDRFDRAVLALGDWSCHRGIGATVHPGDAPIVEGTTLLVVLPALMGSIVVPNRIVAVVDEPDRFGFAYGTLPGHQERGEESFVVERRADGSVVATITVDAVAATPLARLGAPLVSAFQRIAVDRYLAAWRTATDVRSG